MLSWQREEQYLQYICWRTNSSGHRALRKNMVRFCTTQNNIIWWSQGAKTEETKGGSITYRSETSTEMANNIILEVFRFEHLRFEEVIPGKVQRLNQQGKRVWVN
jgi:hypothetical protein